MSRGPKETYEQLPKGRLKLGRLFWALVAFGGIWAVFTVVIFFLTGIVDTSRHRFTGSIRPVAAPVSVSMPKGAYLQEILVDRNEMVYAGQTIALLDTEAMKAHIDHLEADILRDAALRDCLLTSDAMAQGTQGKGVLAEQLDVSLKEANALCAADFETQREAENAHSEALRLLLVDQTLLEQLSQELLKPAQDNDQEDPDNLRQILSLQFAQNRIQEQRLALENQRRAEKQALLAEKERRLGELRQNLQLNADTRRSLLSLLGRPRLSAPESGQIVKLRRFPTGSAAVEDTEFLEIRPSDTQGYMAGFWVPETHRRFVRPGQRVTLKMVGMDDRIPRLWGEISHFETQKPDRVMAFIKMHATSVAALDDPDNGIALRGDSTSAVIQVAYEGYNAFDIIKQDVGIWWAGLSRRMPQIAAFNGPDIIPSAQNDADPDAALYMKTISLR